MLTLHFQIQRRIQHLVKHVFFFKNLLYRCLIGYRIPLWQKFFFKILTFLNPLIKLVTLLKEILKCPECQISWKLERISIVGTNFPESIILGQDHEFQVLYS